jgi:hypothetical protein
LAFAEGWLPSIQKWSAETASAAEVSKQVPPPGRVQPAKEKPDLAEHLIALTTAIDGSLRIYRLVVY